MTTFYICRHGETENNKARILSGWIDSPLTDLGVQNATSAASKLRGIHIDKIVSSDLGRAFISAYIIARRLGFGEEIERLSALREVNYGDLTNQPYANYPNLTLDENSVYAPPNGESLVAMQERVLSCVAELAKMFPDKTILIIAHDGAINAIRASFDTETMGEADTVHNPHDLVIRFNCIEGKITSFTELSGVDNRGANL
jgi:broad specificity phosphatase PhoE